ncbi:MAG: tRNA pseudouridine synthase TruD [Deltaproteobacteria bacterium]|nr:tRNA pseudouridine synthase TruD [Deltaproteobacteria bacterium]
MTQPFLTSDLVGTGGVLRACDDDFVVEEVPAYEPSGAGDHVFVQVEKRGLTTPQAVLAIARALRIRDRDIGVAGMKDRHAVTTQWLSLPPPVTPEAALALVLDGIRIRKATRHGHKLRTGHVRANRFRLRVRGVSAGAAARARAILDRLATAPGAPNWFGEQRFGRGGDNAARGRELVTGVRSLGRDRRLDRLMVSALQSELFNGWLRARIEDGLYRCVIAGDVVHKRAGETGGGGMFASTDPETDTARLIAGEVVPTGPMFGDTMRRPADGTIAAEREDAILEASGLTRDVFTRVKAIAEGTRRDAAIAVADVAVAEADDATIEVAFTLPGGAYATAVMRELMKTRDEPAPASAEAVDETPEPS